MREFGGYLPLELLPKGKGYYNEYHPLQFQCARYAIRHVLELNNTKTVYLPIYICSSVKDVIKDIEIKEYHISECFQPEIDFIEKDAFILITNYFGFKRNRFKSKGAQVIFDNTQAFFEPPVVEANNVYSCRKFFGVTDGAYLISAGINDIKMDRYKPSHASYLLNAINDSTNSAYSESLENEKQLSESGSMNMSVLSERILSGIDYSYVKKRRVENYRYVHEILRNYNEIDAELEDNAVPMVYPFLYSNEKIRERLIEKKIYIPQWWKCVLEGNKGNRFEKKLSKYLLPLPIDQRYSIEDMAEISECIIKCLE